MAISQEVMDPMRGRLYDNTVREMVHDMLREVATGPGDSFDRATALEWFSRNYPVVKSRTVQLNLDAMSANYEGRKHLGVRSDGSDDVLYRLAPDRWRRYDRQSDPPPFPSKRGRKADPPG